MSPLLQDFVTYIGQLEVYGKGAEVLEKLVGVTTSAMQLNKVTDYYGTCCDEKALLTPVLGAVKKDEKVYVEVDGSMVFTRDSDWKEVKVGRVFKQSDYVPSVNEKAGWIRHSQYLAHVGDAGTFTQKMDTLIDNYGIKPEQLIMVTDGAPWIQNWQEDAFAGATFILDFYHAKEHLYSFVKAAFRDAKQGGKWAERQCELLLESKLQMVLKNIKKVSNTASASQAQALINYYQNNAGRMDYKKYRTLGIGIIGSGAIESAHRTLVQKRCKLSGQRWSVKGLQNMLNLKTVYLNEDWGKVIQFTKKIAA